MKFARTPHVTIGMVMVAGIMVSGGCLSLQLESSSLAYVVIDGSSKETIREAVKQVFQDEFYKIQYEGPEGFEFERKATQSDRLRWGVYGDKDLRIRVAVTIEPMERGRILVRADAFILRDGPIGKSEKMPQIGRRPYQNLLNRVRVSMMESRPPPQ